MNATVTSEQAATVARLNALTTHDWTVDAGPLPTVATELCLNDWAHGWGTCYDSTGAESLCPDCEIVSLRRWFLVAGAHVAIDVLQTPTNQKA